MRETWFEAALTELGQVDGLCSVALPTHIGCGIAGGDWSVYHQKVQAFARANSEVRVVLYDQPEAAARRARLGVMPPAPVPAAPPPGAPAQPRPPSPAQSTATTAQYELLDRDDMDLDEF